MNPPSTGTEKRHRLRKWHAWFIVFVIWSLAIGGGWFVWKRSHSRPPPIAIEKARVVAEACVRLFDLPRIDDSIDIHDEHLPQAIRELHPLDIEVTDQDVVIMTPGKPAEYHLTRREGPTGPQVLYVADPDYKGQHLEAFRLHGK